MQTTYGERLKLAREQAGLSQVELATRRGLKPQAVQYLEDPKNHARGSRHTPSFAQECGVDAIWLQSGTGSMLKNQAREPAARYELERPSELAAAIRALRPEMRRAVSKIVAALRHEPREYALSPADARQIRTAARPRRQRSA